MKHLRKYDTVTEDTDDKINKEPFVLIARYSNNTKNPIKVEYIPEDFEDEDIQDLLDKVEQGWGRGVVFPVSEIDEVIKRLKKI